MTIRRIIFALGIGCAVGLHAAEKPAQPAASGPAPTAKSSSAPAAKPNLDEVIATVDGVEIKRRELIATTQAALNQLANRGQRLTTNQLAGLERDLVEQLISRAMLLGEARKQTFEDLDAKVQTAIKATIERMGGDLGFLEMLQRNKLTEVQFNARMRDDVIVREWAKKITEKAGNFTPEEVRAYYDEHRDKFHQPEIVRASEILVRVPPNATPEVRAAKRQKIEAALTAINGGETFASAAQRMSEDLSTANAGGDIGFCKRGTMGPEFDKLAFAMKVNEVSPILTTKAGFVMFQVTARKPAGELPFEGAKEDIEQYLKASRSLEIMREHTAELRKTAKIEVNIPLAPPDPARTANPSTP